MSIVKVTDAKTGKLKRYANEHGEALATVKNGKLRMTPLGLSEGLVVRNGKMVYYRGGGAAY